MRIPRSADRLGRFLSVRPLLLIVAAILMVGISSCSVLPFTSESDEPKAVLRSQALDRPVDTDHGNGAADSTDGPVDDTLFAPGLMDDVRFVSGPCGFESPVGLEPTCGTVEVPADWVTGDGTVRIAVAVFDSTAADPAPDPVVFLEGGPGSHTLETLVFSAADIVEPLLERGDAVFFDQRGVGLTEPRLACQETEELNRRLEDDPSIGPDQATAETHDALARCRSRLIDSGIDLTDYDSISNAHDVEAIRRALGYETWNLYGISYGTKLGLEVLRRHPEGVRSAVLDSVYPPQVDSVRDNPGTFVASLEAVVAACGREPACAADGDLGQRIRQVVAELDRAPVQLTVEDWIGGEFDDVFVTGETLAGVILGALYDPYRFTEIPELIDELESGRTDALETFLSQDRSTERFFSDGMFYSVACREEISFADEAEVAAALPADPFGRTDRFDLASNTGSSAFGTCTAFDNGQAPSISDQPVTSDIPTLLMAGAFDPVTPVSWAEAAAASLANSTLVVAPHLSHGVSPGECGMSVVLQFLDRLSGSLDTGCFGDGEPRFLEPSEDEIELEPVVFPVDVLGVEIETVQAADWTIGTLSGDQYRQQSFLDPAQFIQLAGDDLLVDVLASAFEEDFDLRLGPAVLVSADTTIGSGPVGDLGRSWAYRSGRSDSVAVEWFEADINDIPTVVVLVARAEEVDELLDVMVIPALLAIEVRPL